MQERKHMKIFPIFVSRYGKESIKKVEKRSGEKDPKCLAKSKSASLYQLYNLPSLLETSRLNMTI